MTEERAPGMRIHQPYQTRDDLVRDLESAEPAPNLVAERDALVVRCAELESSLQFSRKRMMLAENRNNDLARDLACANAVIAALKDVLRGRG